MVDVLIVGAGASGLSAGITLARAGYDVLMIEQNDKIGKKLSVTGNGHCNLGNRTFSDDDYVTEMKERFFSNEDLLDSLTSLCEISGIHVIEKDGWIYPKSMQASFVCKRLNRTYQNYGGELLLKHQFNRIEETLDASYIVAVSDLSNGKKIKIACRCILFACGSNASLTKNELHGFENVMTYLNISGHTMKEWHPSLTGLVIEEEMLKTAAGVRVPVTLTGDEEIKESGELQITDKGISGIVTFRLLHRLYVVNRKLSGRKITIDFCNDYTIEQLIDAMLSDMERYPKQSGLELLEGYFPEKLAYAFAKECHIIDRNCEKIAEEEIMVLVHFIKGYEVNVKSSFGFDKAQVSVGGVSMDDVKPDSFESRIMKQIYFAGEILDVTGNCGGYNLMWAFYSGMEAATEIGKELEHIC